MRIGLIARADFTGLGVQTHEFYKHMHPHKTLVVDLAHLNRQKNDLGRYPGSPVLKYTPYPDTQTSDPVAVRMMNEFLDDLDIVFTCETPYDYHLFREARKRGVKTVLQYNFELLDHLPEPRLPMPDLFAAPSLWRFRDVKFGNKVFLPVPVDRERFAPRIRTEAKTFVHVGGTPAMEDRNGTQAVIDAWSRVRGDTKLVVYTQMSNYRVKDRRIDLRRGVVPDQVDFYRDADVMVMPRRFGGLCLPLNEALSCGLPVVMTDLEPQNEFLPDETLMPTVWSKEIMAKTKIDVYSTMPSEIAKVVNRLAEDPALVERMSKESDDIASMISWERLAPMYLRTFEAVVAGEHPKQEFHW